jgi:hypothetical protein
MSALYVVIIAIFYIPIIDNGTIVVSCKQNPSTKFLDPNDNPNPKAVSAGKKGVNQKKKQSAGVEHTRYQLILSEIRPETQFVSQ